MVITDLAAERARLIADASRVVDAMLEIDDRARDAWKDASAQLKAGDVGGAMKALGKVADESARARELAETAAQAIFVLLAIEGKLAEARRRTAV